MNAEQVFEVIEKLIGSVEPYGATHIDSERKENMKTFIEVFDKMHQVIDDVAYKYGGRKEHSIKEIVKLANDHLDSIGIED